MCLETSERVRVPLYLFATNKVASRRLLDPALQAYYRVVPLPQLQQEVMANRDREQEIYDYYSNEAIVVRSEQLQRLSSSTAVLKVRGTWDMCHGGATHREGSSIRIIHSG